MFPLGKVVLALLSLVPMVLSSAMFWVVVALVAFQYSRAAALETRLFGRPYSSPLLMTTYSALLGLAGGLLGSIIFMVVGVTIPRVGISYVWVLAVLLLLVDPRFMCFSYAGGIVALSSLLLGWPADVGVPELMTLVAVLHLIEAVLIRVSGHVGAVPLYIKTKRNRLVGGFSLQKFWPVPFVAMVVIAASALPTGVGPMIQMPDWWPLIKPQAAGTPVADLVYVIFPAVAAVGYSNVAMTTTPWERSRRTAGALLTFSLALLGLAVAGVNWPALRFAAAIFAPLGHEAVIWLGRRQEAGREPIYVPPSRGVLILEVLRGSAAYRAGLRSGDLVLAVNGCGVNSREELREAIGASGGSSFHLDVVKNAVCHGSEHHLTRIPGGEEMLGIVSVPEAGESFYVELGGRGLIGRVAGRALGMLGKRLAGGSRTR